MIRRWRCSPGRRSGRDRVVARSPPGCSPGRAAVLRARRDPGVRGRGAGGAAYSPTYAIIGTSPAGRASSPPCGADRRGAYRPAGRDDSGRIASDATADEAEPVAYQRFDCTGDGPATSQAAVEAARQAVERGECIVLPTDTVYGIGRGRVQPGRGPAAAGREGARPRHAATGADRRAVADPGAGRRGSAAGQGPGGEALARAADGDLPDPAQPPDGSGGHRGDHRPAGAGPRAGPRDPAADRADGGEQRQHQRPAAASAASRRSSSWAIGVRSTSTAARWAAAGGAPSTIVDFTQRDGARSCGAARSAWT